MAIRRNTSRIADTQHRRVCMTLNNSTDVELADFKNIMVTKCSWAIIAKEVGEEGTPHLQMACIFTSSVRFSTLRNLFPRAHIESMKGKPEHSLAYCSKEDLTPWIHGELPEQGKRTDLDDVAEMISAGSTLREVALAHPKVVLKYARGLTVLRSLLASPRDPANPPLVYWFYGTTGTNKTRTAFEWGTATYGDAQVTISSDPTLCWFDGYDGQECVIIDDFRAKGIRFNFLLRLLDRYPLTVPIKGAFVNWAPKCIIITTPSDIITTFEGRNTHRPEDIQQLTRRVTSSHSFPLAQPFGATLELLSTTTTSTTTTSLPTTAILATVLGGPVGLTLGQHGSKPFRRVTPTLKKPALVRQNATIRLTPTTTCCDVCGLFTVYCKCKE